MTTKYYITVNMDVIIFYYAYQWLQLPYPFDNPEAKAPTTPYNWEPQK